MAALVVETGREGDDETTGADEVINGDAGGVERGDCDAVRESGGADSAPGFPEGATVPVPAIEFVVGPVATGDGMADVPGAVTPAGFDETTGGAFGVVEVKEVAGMAPVKELDPAAGAPTEEVGRAAVVLPGVWGAVALDVGAVSAGRVASVVRLVGGIVTDSGLFLAGWGLGFAVAVRSGLRAGEFALDEAEAGVVETGIGASRFPRRRK